MTSEIKTDSSFRSQGNNEAEQKAVNLDGDEDINELEETVMMNGPPTGKECDPIDAVRVPDSLIDESIQILNLGPNELQADEPPKSDLKEMLNELREDINEEDE